MKKKLTKRSNALVYAIPVLILLIFSVSCGKKSVETQKPGLTGIQISESHPEFWTWNGNEIMLLGGSVEDNLFQIDNLGEHLELLRSSGGNYVRNTMSSRDPGNLWPFLKNDAGFYDLNRWDTEYWNRFENFLRLTAEKEIFVQIEVWATFDFYRENWEVNPFNPVNNINYSIRKSKLSDTVTTHPTYTENNFFRSVPSQMALETVLGYQQQYVDKLLSYSLNYDHILYCMDNETAVTSEWGKYWARYIQKQATIKGKKVHTTEMWNPHDLSHPFHAETFDNPDIFTFVDISQNNHKSSDEHWDNGLKQFERLRAIGAVRPANNVKIYGNDGGKHKTTRDAIENYIQNVLMGCASARFHRPTSGQGLNEIARAVIKTMREITDNTDHFHMKPANELLLGREAGEAYCRALKGEQYVVYFPEGGEIALDLSSLNKVEITWYDVLNNKTEKREITPSDTTKIAAPGFDHWIAVIK